MIDAALRAYACTFAWMTACYWWFWLMDKLTGHDTLPRWAMDTPAELVASLAAVWLFLIAVAPRRVWG